MVNLTKDNTKLTGINIVDEAISWNNEENTPLSQWQTDELEKTEKQIEKGTITYSNSQEFDSSMFEYIKSLYTKNNNDVL